MRRLIFIPLLFISILASATIWYVAPTGDDSGAGTIGDPWKTWGFAFNTTNVQPGDTVYFRGGTYVKDMDEGIGWYYYPARNQTSASGGTGYAITRDGTVDDTIKYWAYPDEVPILDCLTAYNTLNRLNYGIRATSVNYVHFKGLIIQNVKQPPGFGDGSGFGDAQAIGVAISGTNLTVENCTFRYMWGTGLEISGSTAPTYNYVINCDAHNCVDSLSTFQPGNDGAGFRHKTGGQVFFKDCRAWFCGDQGWSNYAIEAAYANQYTMYDGCWSFRNGILEGAGHGFKMDGIQYSDGNLKRTYVNCIAAYNRVNGFATFDYIRDTAVYAHVYNNISYHNGYQGSISGYGYGFQIQNVSGSSDAQELRRIFKNNISYDNEIGQIQVLAGAVYTHSNNSWDIPLTVTDAYFSSVDSTGLTGARQSDGSLPNLNFLKLSSTSSAIDAGTDVGLPYEGAAPDLGAFEYDAPSPEEAAVSLITIGSAGSRNVSLQGNVIDDGGGTVSARGIVYGESENPIGNQTASGSGTGEFTVNITGLTPETTYYFRAYATNEAGTAYSSNVSVTTAESFPVNNGGNWIIFGGKIIKW